MKNKVKNMGNGRAVIDIQGVIGWDVTGYSVNRALRELEDGTTDILARLSSIGGYIDDGFDIYAALKNHPANVHVHITNVAASMGSVIAMAGDRITIEPTGMGMIHPPASVVWGTAVEMRKQADVLDTYESRLMQAYMRGDLNLTEEELAEAIADETWYTAQQFVDAGFASEILEGDNGALENASHDDEDEEENRRESARASIEWLRVAQYKNAPDDFLAQLKKNSGTAAASAASGSSSIKHDGNSAEIETKQTGATMSKFTQAELDEAVKAAVQAALDGAQTTASAEAVQAVHDKYAKLAEHKNASNFKALAGLARSNMSTEDALAQMDHVQPATTEAASNSAAPAAGPTAEELQKIASTAAAAAVAEARAAASDTAGVTSPATANSQTVNEADEEAVAKAQREAGAAAAARRNPNKTGA